MNDIGGLGLVGSLVDETGTLVGVSDGAGTTTLTAAQYAGEVYFRPPTDYNGTVDLTVVAVSQEPSSGSTATSDTYALNFSLDPVSQRKHPQTFKTYPCLNIQTLQQMIRTVSILLFMIIILHMRGQHFQTYLLAWLMQPM